MITLIVNEDTLIIVYHKSPLVLWSWWCICDCDCVRWMDIGLARSRHQLGLPPSNINIWSNSHFPAYFRIGLPHLDMLIVWVWVFWEYELIVIMVYRETCYIKYYVCVRNPWWYGVDWLCVFTWACGECIDSMTCCVILPVHCCCVLILHLLFFCWVHGIFRKLLTELV